MGRTAFRRAGGGIRWRNMENNGKYTKIDKNCGLFLLQYDDISGMVGEVASIQ
jgi:hypothetical protein